MKIFPNKLYKKNSVFHIGLKEKKVAEWIIQNNTSLCRGGPVQLPSHISNWWRNNQDQVTRQNQIILATIGGITKAKKEQIM